VLCSAFCAVGLMVRTSHALIIMRKTSIAMETLPILVSVYEDMPLAAHHQSVDDLATSVEWPVLAGLGSPSAADMAVSRPHISDPRWKR